MNLFDSIRMGFPVGAFLIAATNQGLELGKRHFRFSNPEEDKEPQTLVLDGQQRLTAGIQLLIGESEEQLTHYFVSVPKVRENFTEFCASESVTFEDGLDDDTVVDKFLAQLTTDDGYIVAKPGKAKLSSRFRDEGLIHTPLLFKPHNKRYEAHKEEFLAQNSHQKKLLINVIEYGMKIDSGPSVPQIVIPAKQGVEAVSRIFSTLNTSGKVLTPFELVVAILYPKGVDLKADVEAGAEGLVYYPNMDPSREIVLQTAVLLEGHDPKKAGLPKTLTADIWKQNKERSFNALEAVGKFLSENLDMPLQKTSVYTPYDSIFAPLAFAWDQAKVGGITNAVERSEAFRKLRKFVVGSTLTQRYQEGVHNKQKSDAFRLVEWLQGEANKNEPVWLKEAVIPSLKDKSPKGAIGKLMLMLLSRNSPKDPITDEPVALHAEGEDHHIFPTNFVSDLSGWNKSQHSSNLALNIMRTGKATNKEFSNVDPVRQIIKSEKSSSSPATHLKCYNDQLISEQALAIIRRENKGVSDYETFLSERERSFVEYIKNEFGMAHSYDYEVDEVDNDEVSE